MTKNNNNYTHTNIRCDSVRASRRARRKAAAADSTTDSPQIVKEREGMKIIGI